MHLTRFVSDIAYQFLIGYIIDLEFDKESGALKKTKFISEAEVIQQQLASFSLTNSQKPSEEFSLGTSVPPQTVKKLERVRLPRQTENILLSQANTKE